MGRLDAVVGTTEIIKVQPLVEKKRQAKSIRVTNGQRVLEGIKRFPWMLGRRKKDEREQLVLKTNLSAIGTSERVSELKSLKLEIQQMLEQAAEAYKERLRSGSK